jgi:hypothetical protein
MTRCAIGRSTQAVDLQSSRDPHNAHLQSGEEVTICYRYHPYHGEIVTVRQRHITRAGEEVTTVVRASGELSVIPTWMIEPQASQLQLHEPPRFSQESLNELRHFVAVALAALAVAATSTEQDRGAA